MTPISRLSSTGARLSQVSNQRPIPELNAALENRKRPIHVALVQGSYDWTHEGHLGLIRAVANAGPERGGIETFDLVLVLPTYQYDKKPFLQASFERRCALLEEAIEGDPGLRGRVVVSDASARLASAPADLVDAIRAAYPEVHFAYALGADSFNDSSRWPRFETIEKNTELLAVTRPGYSVEATARAAGVIEATEPRVSSTEIRDVLKTGDVSGLEGRVPVGTLRALRKESAAAGATGDAINRPAAIEFREAEARVHRGGLDLLHGLHPTTLPPALADSLKSLQDRCNAQNEKIEQMTFDVDSRGINPQKGYTDKLILNAHDHGKFAGRYLFKHLSPENAAKVEFLTVLANLAGIETPLATPFTRPSTDPHSPPDTGVLIPWIPNTTVISPAAVAEVSEDAGVYLLMTRWLNELIGNQDVWTGQYLVPKDEADHPSHVVNIDPDNAFLRRDKRWVQKVLHDHFHIDAEEDEAAWTDKAFEFEASQGWDPSHYDSMFTIYGLLLRAFVADGKALPLDRVKERLQALKGTPPVVLLNAMQRFLDTAWMANDGYIPVQAAGKFLDKVEFEEKFLARFYRSLDEFGGFLSTLTDAQADENHPIHQFYKNAAATSY